MSDNNHMVNPTDTKTRNSAIFSRFPGFLCREKELQYNAVAPFNMQKKMVQRGNLHHIGDLTRWYHN
jgi:hypothetical protein